MKRISAILALFAIVGMAFAAGCGDNTATDTATPAPGGNGPKMASPNAAPAAPGKMAPGAPAGAPPGPAGAPK